MPGRLVMDVKEPQGLGGLKRDGSHLSQQSEGREQKRVASDASRAKLNGAPLSPSGANTQADAPVINGVLHENNGGVKQEASAHLGIAGGEAPELEQYRDTLVPLGKIIERMAQQTYFDLSEAIESLADIQISNQAQLTNGVGGPVSQDKSRESLHKKERLLNFAQTHKDRFIKTLVLSDWARNMDDMSKLIDVSMFLRKQDWATHGAADSIYRLKENMIGAKMPNPNIEGALELLSTGEAPWMPDMGYIPPKSLTAQELLDTLSDMNFALSVRLNLHEDLPPHFQKYSIANGRATFTVDGEFEVDLAVADDDPESFFYFIDIRLLCSPTTEFNNDRLRNQLEARMNEVLATSGLDGCYNFLHNFVLTHKLNVLRCQALQLARGKWIDNIDVQAIHRSVVVHYWKNQNGGKNWIELGIGSGKQGSGTKRKPLPQISCRWFRRGQEVTDHDLDFNFTNISMEDMLEQVIAKHISGRLTALSAGLGSLAPDTSCLTQELVTSSVESSDCSLRLGMRGTNTAMTITTDPIRGAYCVQPQSSATREIERRLNNDPLVDAPAVLRFNICRQQLGQIEIRVRGLGLNRIDATSHKGSASQILREAVVFTTLQRLSWGSETKSMANCALTLTYDLVDGPTWYLARLGESKDGRHIATLEALNTEDETMRKVDIRALLRIERAALEISCASSTASDLGKPEALLPGQSFQQPDAQSTGREGQLRFPMAYNPNKLLLGRSVSKSVAQGVHIFSNTGALDMEIPRDDDDNAGIIYYFRTNLHSSVMTKTIQLLFRSLKGEQGIWVGAKGEVQIMVRAALGTPIKLKLQAKLQSVSNFCAYVDVLGSNHFAVISLEFDSIKFSYAPRLTCRVRLSGEDTSPLLDFGLQGNTGSTDENPHASLRKQLETVFVPSDVFAPRTTLSSEKLANFCQVLRATLSIIKCAKTFESREPVASSLLHCHNALDLRITYRAPLPILSFSINGRTREGRVSWWVKPIITTQDDQLRSTLGQMFKSKGEGWHGTRGGVIATVEGIGPLLNQIDEVIRNLARQPTQPQTKPAQQAVQQPAPQRTASKTNKGRGQEVVVLD
ncbi:hypothetical protein B9Z65_7772 [Elsinoe australis]|uniref:Mediator of RNA polymerase II transcription subunit 14 n=1 Tax=Elsinoe australis TaxID=40998 RepID=A0A2P8A0K0_9PEZI|nr:hypothetical protein B9Z65_7772 [Elsinoe australis]